MKSLAKLPGILLLIGLGSVSTSAKERLFVLTDIGGDPDDQMSMVRLMTYANHMDIEGLVATPTGSRSSVAPEHIQRIIDAHGKVRDNLELHESGYPTAEYLRDRITKGIPFDGMQGVGEGKDSAGSELLIRAVDRDDPRPLWVTVWGGPNVLAQALWKVRATRSPDELAGFVAKLRVYAISDQDNSGPWIRRKGPLGAVYPGWEFMMEGDTPSFLNLINNGLSDPERPNWGGWGGRYELYTPRMEKWFLEPETRPIWTNVQDEVLGNDGEWHTTNHATIWRWRSACRTTSPHAWTGRSNPMTRRTTRRFPGLTIQP
ncbi:MAG: DUF1593 domain-containing protein [Bryobacterales bacterium]|nr:DUF1593 domain-containing protein [Bryobacterales bacterium]